MEEEVLSAGVANEAKALVALKPLDSAGRHTSLLEQRRALVRRRARRVGERLTRMLAPRSQRAATRLFLETGCKRPQRPASGPQFLLSVLPRRRPWLRSVKSNHVEALRGLRAQLPQQRRDLAPVIAAMVRDVLNHLPEGVLGGLPAQGLVLVHAVESCLALALDEAPDLLFQCPPGHADRCNVRVIFGRDHGGRGL